MATGGGTRESNTCESNAGNLQNCSDCKLEQRENCNKNIDTNILTNLDCNVSKLNETENSEENDVKLEQFSKYPCAVHTQSSCFAICNHCTKCLCNDCLQVPNQEMYNDRLATIKEYQEEIDQDLPFFTQQLESLNELEEKYEEKYNSMKDQISDRKEKLKRLATEETTKLEKELDGLWNGTKKAMKDEKARMTEAEKDLTSRKDVVEKALSFKDAGSIITAVDKVARNMPEKIVPSIKEPPNILFSTKFSTQSIALGSIIKIPRLRISNSMECDATDILAIYDDKALIGYDKNRRILKQFVLTLDGVYVSKTFGQPIIKNKQVNCEVTFTFTNFTCKINNTQEALLIRSLKKTESCDTISLVTASQQIKRNCKTKISAEILQLSTHDGEYTPTVGNSPITAVHFDTKGKIYVSYQSSSFNGFTGIAIFNPQFEKLQQFEIGVINQAKAIIANTNEDICILDNPPKSEGRLIVFNKSVQFRWEFSGSQIQPNRFYPEQIANSSKGYIFISDKINNTVFMLSQDGDLLASLGETVGICQPSELAVNKKDQLIVGCPGMLHIVDIQEDSTDTSEDLE